jgi:hypothetical protein
MEKDFRFWVARAGMDVVIFVHEPERLAKARSWRGRADPKQTEEDKESWGIDYEDSVTDFCYAEFKSLTGITLRDGQKARVELLVT